MPLKLTDTPIVILKALPLVQWLQCGDTKLDQATMFRVDQLLRAANRTADPEVSRYAA